MKLENIVVARTIQYLAEGRAHIWCMLAGFRQPRGGANERREVRRA